MGRRNDYRLRWRPWTDQRHGKRTFTLCRVARNLTSTSLAGLGIRRSHLDAGRRARCRCPLSRRPFPPFWGVSSAIAVTAKSLLTLPLPCSNIKPDPHSSLPSSHNDVSSGVRRCQIWGASATLPPIAGMILISGVYDIVKQLRHEAKLGIEDSESRQRCTVLSSQLT